MYVTEMLKIQNLFNQYNWVNSDEGYWLNYWEAFEYLT